MNLAQTWAALGAGQRAEAALAQAVDLGYPDPDAARRRMEALLEQARRFSAAGEEPCYLPEWDGQRRQSPTGDEVCACLRALEPGRTDYLLLTAP